MRVRQSSADPAERNLYRGGIRALLTARLLTMIINRILINLIHVRGASAVSVTSIVEGAGPRVPVIRHVRDEESGDRPPPEHTVLGRSASIMEAFNCAQQVLSLADLNKRTRLPKSTLHRLR